jgi:hypothetical protein
MDAEQGIAAPGQTADSETVPLREALGEGTDIPRFIETLPRRRYRYKVIGAFQPGY